MNHAGFLTEFRKEMTQHRGQANERLDQHKEELRSHEKVIERLAFRSIAQEADIVALKRAR